MKTSELTGAMLDYWVAKAEGFPQCGLHAEDGQTVCFLGPVAMERFTWAPSTAWEQGGPIIERNDWLLPYRTPGHRLHLGAYSSQTPGGFEYSGPTPLVAAMRAFVAANFGDEVPDPG